MLARSVCSARAVRFSCSHSSSTSVAQGGCVGSSASGGTREAFTLSTMSGKPQIVRLLTLGDSGAGKSSLLLRYTQNEFTHEYMPTIGIDFRLKTVEIRGKTIKVQVWDTAGQERFRTITHNYYRGAHGIALVYDVTNRSSFENIRKWVQDVHTYAEQSVDLVLIGNKCDLSANKAVQTDEGQQLADEYDVKFFETSAKAGNNVDEAFSTLVDDVVARMYSGSGSRAVPTGGTVEVRAQPAQSAKKGCC